MPIWIVFLIINTVIQGIEAVLGNSARQRAQDTKAQDLTVPTADAGKPIPVGWGTFELGPNVVWWGNQQKRKNKQWFYLISMHAVFCWGIVNEIIDFTFNGKSVRNNHLVNGGEPALDGSADGVVNTDGTPAAIAINGNQAPHSEDHSHAMFGGESQQGGIGGDLDGVEGDGDVRIYWGSDDQPMDDLLSSSIAYDTNCSRWPRMAYASFGSADGTYGFYCASGGGQPAALRALLRRTAWWDGAPGGALSPLGQTPEDATIRYDANAAEILYDILTNEAYGLGRDPSRIDIASFQAVAAALLAEPIAADKTGFGISIAIGDGGSAESVIMAILSHIGATLASSPLTGLLRLKLVRADYDVDDLLVIDPSNASEFDYHPGSWDNTYNDTGVTFNRFQNDNEHRGFVSDRVSHPDLANFMALGLVRSQTVDLPYITDPDIAALCCARTARASSVPLATASWKMNRQGYALMAGDVVKVNWPPFGIESLILRITQPNYAMPTDGQMSFSAAEDVFAATHSTYAAPQTTGWTEPVPTTTDESGDGSGPDDAGTVDSGVGFY